MLDYDRLCLRCNATHHFVEFANAEDAQVHGRCYAKSWFLVSVHFLLQTSH